MLIIVDIKVLNNEIIINLVSLSVTAAVTIIGSNQGFVGKSFVVKNVNILNDCIKMEFCSYAMFVGIRNYLTLTANHVSERKL